MNEALLPAITIAFCTIMVLHWVGDFLLQSHEIAMNKSTSNAWLTYHIALYISPFTLTYIFFEDMGTTALYMLVNGAIHFVVDYFSSRTAKKYYSKNEMHMFFVVIGTDQLLHILTLMITFAWLIELV